jgi:hypothetical protein
MNRLIFALILLVSSVGAGCTEAVTQSEDCAAYVECVRAIDARDGVETDVERFEADGDCWGSDEGATLCDRACTRGADYLRRQSGPLPQECES